MTVRHFLWIALVVLLGIFSGCQGPSPTLIAGSKKTGASLVPDPQIAVGKTLLAAVDTSDVTFFNKTDLSALGSGTCGGPKPLWCPTNNLLGTCVASNVCSTSNLFAATQLSLNQNLKGEYCDPENPNAPPIKDETGKVTWASSCVVDMGYDSRSLYDPTSQRFWIVAQVRNHVWACTTDDNQPGGKLGSGADIEDPKGDQTDPTNTFCHAWLANLAQRYLAVAVSRQGENLAQGFYTYILVNTVGDWPQFTVHDGYLILGHRDPGLKIWVFDANALAAGTDDGSSLKVAPLLVVDPSQLTPPPDSQLIPVNIHGNSQGVTYLLGGYHNNLYIYGLASPPGNPSGKPTLLGSAMVPINRSLVGAQVRSPAVFQNGNIYLASHDCPASSPNGCAAPFMYILRVPVKRSGNQLVADLSASGGFMDYAVGKSDTPVVAFEVPALDVTDNGDIVVVYSSGEPSLNKPAGAYYQVFYHGQTAVSNSATLQDPIVGSVPAGNPSGLDLGGAALDPQLDGSNKRTIVWISHGFANGGNSPTFNYTSVFGAVKP